MRYYKHYTFFAFVLFLAFQTVYSENKKIKTDKRKPSLSSTIISGFIDSLKKDEQIILHVIDKDLGRNSPYREFIGNHTNGNFIFRLDSIEGISFVTISLNSERSEQGELKPIIDKYILENGDSLHMKLKLNRWRPMYRKEMQVQVAPERIYEMEFTGRGFEKFKCQAHVNRYISWDLIYGIPEKGYGMQGDNLDQLEEFLSLWDEAMNKSITLLQKNRTSIHPNVYELIRTNLISKIEDTKFNYTQVKRRWANTQEVVNGIDSVYKKRFIIPILSDVSSEIRAASESYLSYQANRFYDETPLKGKERILAVHRKIDNNFDGVLRDCLTAYSFDRFYKNNYPDSLISKILSTVKDENCLALIQAKLNAAPIGSMVSAEKLNDVTGKQISISDLRGKVVFMDLWFTGCQGCILYYEKVVSRVEEHYRNNPDLVFVSVNIDKSKDKWLKSIKEGKYTNEHILNLNTGELSKVHPFIKSFGINAYPTPILIDHTGKIVQRSNPLRSEKTLLDNIEAALKKKSENGK